MNINKVYCAEIDRIIGVTYKGDNIWNYKKVFELDPKLKDIASFIESLNKEQLDTFIDTIISASSGAYFDLKPIDDIELYQEKIMV